MPEGHTIHRLARDLGKSFATGTVQASSPQGRFSDGAAELDGTELFKANAFGKHLFLEFEPAVLHIHLGLIGKFRPVPVGEAARDSNRLRHGNEAGLWDLTGPQDCRLISRAEQAEVTDRLGPDPLRRGARPDGFVEALSRRRTPIAAALLDQAVIAGIGNVYRAEFLFLQGIDPHHPAASISTDQAIAIWELSRDQLRQGVRLNRIVTVGKDDSGTKPGRLAREDALYVYKREGLPCRRCGTEISIGDVGGRSCWWCHACQR
ncbi:MAG: Fpg/Nei family DNA glycosylase [Actinomycetota bacterium]|nr:Fpg/Nei family DNA glycosylase [Actinomycetota bacterium]